MLVFLYLPLSAQNVVLSGLVTDAQTGEPLIGVTVYNTNRRTGTTTNSTGHYTITLPSNRALEVVYSYVGYASETQNVTLTRDTKLDIQLKQDTQNLREVQVYGTRHNFGVQSSQMSAIAVSAEQIRKLPSLLGEVDVLKSLQRLPGVQSSGEGRAGIFVRGGDYDQNLFTLDGITLYNPEHLQGFTSAVNADVMDDVVLYKGAFPSRYGGRLSSVIDVSLREGDMERHRLSATAGMLASRIQAEGPLWKGHTSYNIAARVSYFSAIVKPMLEELIYDNPGQMNAYSHMRYWDLNAKLMHRFSENDKLSAVFYMGHDVNNATPNETAQLFEYSPYFIDIIERSETRDRWSNLLGGLLYTHQFSPDLRLDASVSYSGYNNKLSYINDKSNKVGLNLFSGGRDVAELFSLHNSDYNTTYRSEIHDLGVKANLTYLIGGAHEVQGGLQINSQRLTPSFSSDYYTNLKSAANEAAVKNIGLGDDRYTITENQLSNTLKGSHTVTAIAAHAEDDWDINEKLKANLGIRLQGYVTEGSMKLAIEPRASLRMLLSKGISLKASYARMSQGLFLLSNSSLVNPSDVWIPLFKEMDLGISDQLSLGYNQDLSSGINLSVEGYYKWLDGAVDYKEGASLAGSSDWNDAIAQGKGKAYGVELMAQKTIGNTTGHVSYTWSKALRTFDREGMVLSNGREFFAIGDRRHNFNITITQRLSKNWDLSAAWTYQSGRRATFASTSVPSPVFDEFNNYIPLVDGYKRQWYPENPAYETTTDGYYEDTYVAHVVRMNTYGKRNGYVLPAVHRLDLSLSHHGSIGIGEMICDISIYNLYNQQNISTVYWGFQDNRRALKGVCMFPIMPSISLTLKL
ncbi:MAG: carboxypeptidase-like regulatory domain-containing protein [Bacteroidales bacterium]|nr:carboxypeptidase-like regulatory domain-containing protein [Bacteroidales bacterium]